MLSLVLATKSELASEGQFETVELEGLKLTFRNRTRFKNTRLSRNTIAEIVSDVVNDLRDE
jgi:hypothetical protein